MPRLVAVLVLLGACAPQEDASYRGEVLIALAGTVANARTATTPPADVALAWSNAAADAGGLERAAVEGAFPARFTLEVFAPPPPAVLGASPVAVAVLAALPRDVALDDLAAVRARLLGACTTHVLLYAARDVGLDEETGRLLGFPIARGFHVLAVVPASGEEPTDGLAEVAGAPTLSIELVDEPAAIDLPNLF